MRHITLFFVLALGYALGSVQPTADASLRPRVHMHAAQIVGSTSVITSKPANGDQVKTGQRKRPGQSCFTPPNPLAAS